MTYLFEIEASGIWQEKPSHDHAHKAKPWNDIEFRLCINVVVKYTRGERTKLTHGSRKSVGGSPDRGREHLRSNKESD